MTPFIEHLITVLVCVFCTIILAPIIVGTFLKKVETKDIEKEKILAERDAARKDNETQWHSTVLSTISTLSGIIESAMETNKKDNQELWNSFKDHGHQVECTNDACHNIKVVGVTISNRGRRD
jgi:hypothetical protein